MDKKLFDCTIPMYGLPYEITTVREVKIRLEDGAGMARVIAAMREKLPALAGKVFRSAEDRLEEGYKFNVNGRFYFDGEDFAVRAGDRIALLVPVVGG
jgi:molybdopterin converting factor small subunit